MMNKLESTVYVVCLVCVLLIIFVVIVLTSECGFSIDIPVINIDRSNCGGGS